MISIMALEYSKYQNSFTPIKVNFKMVSSMDREQKCGIKIANRLMLEKYMLVRSNKVREMVLGFAHTLMVVNMKEDGKTI